MREKLNRCMAWILGKQENSVNKSSPSANEEINNANILIKQLRISLSVLLMAAVVGGGVMLFIQGKAETKTKSAVVEDPVLTVELADKNLDPEKHWRNHFEERQNKLSKEFNERLKLLEDAQVESSNKVNNRIEEELSETKEKLAMAQRELSSASLDLKRASSQKQSKGQIPSYQSAELSVQEFEQDVEFGIPKSAKNYIPEGTYFTGHLLGGIAVSTGLNTPVDNAIPVVIKLIARFDANKRKTTNLSKDNKLALENCRIMGSSYGDLSSERAIVRLEKMVCEHNGVYITSKIAGQLHGSDGLNGIKGTIISTSSKHIKNAAIGGLISGIASSAKGQDAETINPFGLVSTQKKGAKDLLTEGGIQGASNAGEKIADYYLRQAEAMSPVLTVPSGVRVNAQITKGFFVGEVSTHKKIKQERSSSTANSDINEDYKTDYME